MRWNPALIDGPIPIPVWSAPDADGDRTVVGWRDGYRLNTTAEVLAARPELAAFRVEPPRMIRVWAGDDPEAPTVTVALRFADEAEAAEVLGFALMEDAADE